MSLVRDAMIYLDNAATTFKKPDSVLHAVKKCIKKYSANPGRSGHSISLSASELLYDTRCAVASLFNYPNPENVVFTMNATYALNMAIKTLINRKCHVIISDREHNSVLRPLKILSDTLGIEYSVYNSRANNVYHEIESHIREDTYAIISTLASNVTGEKIPLFLLSELKRKHGLLLILDASQAAGHIPIDLGAAEFDAFIAPGHKALMGIMGVGFCIFNKSPEVSFIEGGSGSESRSEYMPNNLPESMEAGTVPLPAIASLKSGIEFIKMKHVECIERRLNILMKKCTEMVRDIDGITVYGDENGILSFNICGIPAEEVGRRLSEKKIAVRAGLHCAPLAHKSIGTYESGCVRASFSYFNTEKEVDSFITALKNIKSELNREL